MGASTGQHAINFLGFDEDLCRFERYMCIIPYGHGVRYNAIHGESSVNELNCAYMVAGAKIRVMCTIGGMSENPCNSEYRLKHELQNVQKSNVFNLVEFAQLLKSRVPTEKFLQKSFFDVR